MGDALTRYRVDYKGGFATSDLTGFSSGVSVNFASGNEQHRLVSPPLTRSDLLQVAVASSHPTIVAIPCTLWKPDLL